ncbi:MAG: hypothetical protein HN936_08850 [Bacteroidetes bacterium]|jgi:predicted DNA-binding protein|nr:hypothetical protein [Bacteroidota bacterium]MBT7093342.1 hypothetical protein [Bacteroidota bacterium]
MTTKQNKLTRNIRIPVKLHSKLKGICEREGRIMSAFVTSILEDRITEDSVEKKIGMN